MRGIPHSEKLFMGGDFNGHIRNTSSSYVDVHGSFGFRDRNKGGVLILDLDNAFDLVIANSSSMKEEGHLVTFCSTVTI